MIEKFDYSHLEETLYHFTLDNGLKIYLIPKNQFQETFASMTVFFGAIHSNIEKDGLTISYPYGIAHFLEHKLFEKEDEKDLLISFTNLGAESNAYTSHKKTTYLFSTTADVIKTLELLQKLVFEPYFSEESLKKEVDIINQEIAMYLDDPEYALYQGILALLYPNSALAIDIAGTKETIEEITIDQLYQNTEYFYRPDNMALVIAGNIDVNEIEEFLKKDQVIDIGSDNEYLTDLTSHAIEKYPVLSSDSIEMDVSQPKLAVGFRPSTEPSDENEAIIQKLSLLLWLEMIFGETSQLYQQWYEEGRFALSMNYELEFEQEFQFLIITLETTEPIAMTSRIKTAVQSSFDNPDFSDERLMQVKKEWQGAYFRQLDQLENFVGQFVVNLGKGASSNYLDYPKLVEQITLETIRSTVQSFCQKLDVTDYTIFPKTRKKY